MATIKQENTTDDKAALLATNHRYFIRQTISTACGLVIISLIFMFIMMMCSATITSNANSLRPSDMTGTTAFMIAACIGYLVLFVIQLAKIISLHAKVTNIEDSFIFVVNGEPAYSMHKLGKK